MASPRHSSRISHQALAAFEDGDEETDSDGGNSNSNNGSNSNSNRTRARTSDGCMSATARQNQWQLRDGKQQPSSNRSGRATLPQL